MGVGVGVGVAALCYLATNPWGSLADSPFVETPYLIQCTNSCSAPVVRGTSV